MGKRILFIDPPVLATSIWQMYNYAEPYPYGLLKLGTLLRKQGHAVALLELMAYEHLEKGVIARWPEGSTFHSNKEAGNRHVKGALRPTYLVGRDMDYLRERLRAMGRPDEIWVSACLTFNWEPTHDTIAVCKEVYPDVPVKLGGNYPTLTPEHARTSLADEVVEGPVDEAEWLFGDLTLFSKPPVLGLFNIGTGCSNRCSFCVNHRYMPTLRHRAANIVRYLVKVRQKLGIRHFSNWDPNVMLFPDVLEEFLDMMAAADTDITLGFNMGIQPNKLTPRIAEKMLRAGVTQLTIPFETSDPVQWRRYKKPYKFEASAKTMAMLQEVGFPVGRFHSTAVFGYDDEDPRHLFRTYLTMVAFSGQPVFFPITPTPGSEAFEEQRPALEGKPLDELNGYLFPLLGSAEKVALYDQLIELLNQHYLERALPLVKNLPQDLERIFFEELEHVSEVRQREGLSPLSAP